ncbi:RIP metalloprotease RseP, partial [Vibrio sp. 10N.222.46.A1]
LDISDWSFNPETESAMTTLGFRPYSPEISTVLAQVIDDGAAYSAGLESGDKIVEINGQPIEQWKSVVELIRSHPMMPLDLVVLRNGIERSLVMTPNSREFSDGSTIGYAGIAPEVAEWPEDYRFELQFGVIESVGKAFNKTGQIIGLTLTMLKKLIVGDVGLNNLSGPISIAKGAGATADYGLVYFLGFLALISVNLGIINLVPLPMLDGGHLLFFAIEAVTRKPVPEKVQEMGYRVGGAILFSLMALAIFNDFTRL